MGSTEAFFFLKLLTFCNLLMTSETYGIQLETTFHGPPSNSIGYIIACTSSFKKMDALID